MKRYAALLAVVVLLAGCGPANLARGVITGKDHYDSYVWLMPIYHQQCYPTGKTEYCTTWTQFIPITEPERWVLHVHGCDKDGCRDNDVNVSEDVFTAARVGNDWTRPKFAASRSELQPDVDPPSVIPGVALDLARTTGTAAEVRSGTPRSFARSDTLVRAPSVASRRTRPAALSDPRYPAPARSTPVPAPRKRLVASVRTQVGLSGTVSWFCVVGRSACTYGYPASGAFAAAGPAVRAALGDWRGRYVTVSTHRVSVRVRLVDWCSCPGNRLLDLYGSVYAQLDSLASGLLDVEVGL